MKGQSSSVSIRVSMRNLYVVMILTLVFLCGGMTVFKTQMITQLQVSTDEITNLNRYIGSLGLLRGYATDYSSSLSPDARQQSELLMQALSDSAGTLNSHLDANAERIESAVADVDHYMETVVLLMNEQDNAMDFASYYNHSEQIWRSLQPRLFTFLNEAIDRYTNISERVFSQNVTSLWIIGLTILLVSAILIWYSRRTINRIAKPVQYLTRQSLRMADGEYVLAEPGQVSSCAETQVLAQAFNMMVGKIRAQVRELQSRIEADERIHALEMENASMQITLSETERRLLQSMMNPHFLFNCLGTISSMAYLEDADKTVSIIRQISAFLHESLRSIGREISIAEEIVSIERYVSIEKMRFGERVQFIVQCDTSSAERIIPAMLLQPLVENAITHGISPKVEGGTVSLRIQEEAESTLVIVEDNGVGLAPGQAERLNSYLDSDPPPGKGVDTGIGLTSIRRQMKNHFGGKATLLIANREEGGVRVTLHCPHLAAP